MTNDSNKARFIKLCMDTERNGMNELLAWLEKTDFYVCPASTKYHGSYFGGLLEHSLDVYDEMQRLLKVYPEIEASHDSVVIVSLLHDLCKANFYTIEKRNRKNESGQWETYDYYGISEKFCYGGHGSKSVFLAQFFLDLTPEEAVAINCHMGIGEDQYVGNAYEQCPFAWLLHVADESACYVKNRMPKE